MMKVLFPGSFDPFTTGHLEVVRQASGLFQEVVVGIGLNSKRQHLFTLESRMAQIEAACRDMGNVRVVSFHGLTAEYCHEQGMSAILRGLRNGHDLDYETPIAHMNMHMEGIPTLFLTTPPEYSTISGTIVREIYKYQRPIDSFAPASELLQTH